MRTQRPLLMLAVPAFLAGIALAGPQTSWETSFERQTNDRQPPAKVLPAIGVRPGLVIGEVGAGRGRYTVHLARAVGEGGKVYAEDINADGLDYLRRRCQGERKNIRQCFTAMRRTHIPNGASPRNSPSLRNTSTNVSCSTSSASSGLSSSRRARL